MPYDPGNDVGWSRMPLALDTAVCLPPPLLLLPPDGLCILPCDCGLVANRGHCGARTQLPTAVGSSFAIRPQSEALSKKMHGLSRRHTAQRHVLPASIQG